MSCYHYRKPTAMKSCA